MADRYGYGDYTSPGGRRTLGPADRAANARVNQGMPDFRVTNPAARNMGFEGVGIDPSYPDQRLRDMNLGADPPGYGVDTDPRGWTYQRRAEDLSPYGQMRVHEGPYTPAQQEALAREFERLYGPGGDGLTPNRRINRAFIDAGRARGRAQPVPGMKTYRLDYYDELAPAFGRQLRQNPQMRRNLRTTGALGMRRLDPDKLARRPNAPPYPGMDDSLVAQMRAQDMRDPVNQLRAYQNKVDSGLWTPEQAAAFVDRRRGIGGGVAAPAGSIGGAIGYGGYRSGTGSPSLNR